MRFLRTSSAFQALATVDDEELRRLQTTGEKVLQDMAPGRLGLPAHVLTASRTFWPSRRTPTATSSGTDVTRLSRRALTPVPSRISRTRSSPDKSRAYQLSQSVFTLRQARLTASLPTLPPNRPASARRTRRVLVPAR